MLLVIVQVEEQLRGLSPSVNKVVNHVTSDGTVHAQGNIRPTHSRALGTVNYDESVTMLFEKRLAISLKAFDLRLFWFQSLTSAKS